MQEQTVVELSQLCHRSCGRGEWAGCMHFKSASLCFPKCEIHRMANWVFNQ